MPNSPYDTKRPRFDEALFAERERANDRAHRQYLASPTACTWGQGQPLTLCRECRNARCVEDVCKACRGSV